MRSFREFVPTSALVASHIAAAVSEVMTRFHSLEKVRSLEECRKEQAISRFRLWSFAFLRLDHIVNRCYPMLAAVLLLTLMSCEILVAPAIIQHLSGVDAFIPSEQRLLLGLLSVVVATGVLWFTLWCFKLLSEFAIQISHASLIRVWIICFVAGSAGFCGCCIVLLQLADSPAKVCLVSASAACAACLGTPPLLFPVLEWAHDFILMNWCRNAPDALIAGSLFEIVSKLEDENGEWEDIQFRCSLVPAFDRAVTCLEVGVPYLYGESNHESRRDFEERAFRIAGAVRSMKARLLFPRDGTLDDLKRHAGQMLFQVISGDWHSIEQLEIARLARPPKAPRGSRLFSKSVKAVLPLCAFGVMQLTPLKLEGDIGVYVARGLVFWAVVRLLGVMDSSGNERANSLIESIGGFLKEFAQSREVPGV